MLAILTQIDFGLTRLNLKSARVKIAYTTKNETENETGCDTVGFVYCERPYFRPWPPCGSLSVEKRAVRFANLIPQI